MEAEREDMVAPETRTFNTLNYGEQQAVYRYLCGGALPHALADYFNTTITQINAARERGDLFKWNQK